MICFYSTRDNNHAGLNAGRCVCVVFINASMSTVQFLELRYATLHRSPARACTYALPSLPYDDSDIQPRHPRARRVFPSNPVCAETNPGISTNNPTYVRRLFFIFHLRFPRKKSEDAGRWRVTYNGSEYDASKVRYFLHVYCPG